MVNPITTFLEQQGSFILDGGLATELEGRGYDLNDSLWSARLLTEDPGAIQAVHETYLVAGADCIITASYQATIPGFVSRGSTVAEAEMLLRRSVELGLQARQRVQADGTLGTGRIPPLVAASIGPYGAYLADGSEYDGRYGLSVGQLKAFHQRRWQLLAESKADLMACETIPSFLELQALTELLVTHPKWSWFSFSCRDGQQLHDGTPIETCAAWLAGRDHVAAIGVNCTAPQYVAELVQRLREVADYPIVVYPNSGESYDGVTKQWSGTADPIDFAAASEGWQQNGATLIGGCCRTGPEHIRRLRESLV